MNGQSPLENRDGKNTQLRWKAGPSLYPNTCPTAMGEPGPQSTLAATSHRGRPGRK